MLTNQHLIQAFEAAGAERGLVYLGVPITSGRREIDLLRRLGVASAELRRCHADRWRKEVLEPNEEDAAICAAKARAVANGELIVDPSRMAVAGWEPDDYNRFWTSLLKKYATRIVAAPGWEFSKGARGEIGYAITVGLPVVNLDGEPLTVQELRAIDASARQALLDEGWADVEVDGHLPSMDCAPRLERGAASQAFDWLVRERVYQVGKFGIEDDDEHTREGLGQDAWWSRQLSSYYHRPRILTLDTLVGRQALAKFAATACGLLESAIRVHGRLPEPGVPSGHVTPADD